MPLPLLLRSCLALTMLHVVQALIGNPHQGILLLAVQRENGNSIIESETYARLHTLHCRSEIRANTASQRICLFGIRMHQEQCEFVAPDAKSVVRGSQRLAQRRGGRPQKQVSLRMAESVVHFFELMKVEDHQREVLIVSLRTVELFVEVFIE